MIRADIYQPEFGCGFGDFICYGQESVARIIASWIRAMGNFIADMFLNTFKGRIEETSWTTAYEQFWFWASIMTGVVLVVLIYQTIIGSLLRDMRRIGVSVIGALASVTLAGVAVTVTGKLTGWADGASEAVVSTIQGGAMSDALLKMSGMSLISEAADAASATEAEFNENSALYHLLERGATQTGMGNLLWAGVLMMFMALAAGVLHLLMEIRDFGLLALAALAPIGLMLLGQGKLGAWAERWTAMVCGLILAKPLAAGVLVLAVQITGATVDIGAFIVAVGAIFAAAFSPFWAVKLVSFAGSEVGNAMQRRGSTTQTIQKVGTFRTLVKR